jgi:hypothetical protein
MWRRGDQRVLRNHGQLPLGWKTTDADEIALRRWRGATEIVAVEALEPDVEIFGTFRVRSGTGSSYEVEIRSLAGHANSCDCIDHRVNGLGTCKHIEGVLAAIERKSGKAFREVAKQGSPRIRCSSIGATPRRRGSFFRRPDGSLQRPAIGSRRFSPPMARLRLMRAKSRR